MSRHTMGQDWGGRRAQNPDDAPKVTRKQVEIAASLRGIEIRREGKGMWWFKDPDTGTWLTLGMTNYLAVWFLEFKFPKKRK